MSGGLLHQLTPTDLPINVRQAKRSRGSLEAPPEEPPEAFPDDPAGGAAGGFGFAPYHTAVTHWFFVRKLYRIARETSLAHVTSLHTMETQCVG